MGFANDQEEIDALNSQAPTSFSSDMEELAYLNKEPYEKPSFFKETGKSLMRGGAGVGSMTGHLLKTAGAEKLGESLDVASEELAAKYPMNPEIAAAPIKGGVQQGFESMPSSMAAGAPGAVIGGLLGGGPIGAYVGYALSGGTVMGLAEYQNYLDEYKQEFGEDPDLTTKAHAALSGLAEGGLEFASDLIGGAAIFGNTPVKGTIKSLLRTPLKDVAKAVAQITAAEVPTEMATSYSEAALRKSQGIPTAEPWEAAKGAIVPAATMGLLFTAGGLGLKRLQNSRTEKALEDPNTDPESRLKAASHVNANLMAAYTDPETKEVTEEGKRLSEAWKEYALNSVASQKPISLDMALDPVSLNIESLKADPFLKDEADAVDFTKPIDVEKETAEPETKVRVKNGQYEVTDATGVRMVNPETIPDEATFNELRKQAQATAAWDAKNPVQKGVQNGQVQTEAPLKGKATSLGLFEQRTKEATSLTPEVAQTLRMKDLERLAVQSGDENGVAQTEINRRLAETGNSEQILTKEQLINLQARRGKTAVKEAKERYEKRIGALMEKADRGDFYNVQQLDKLDDADLKEITKKSKNLSVVDMAKSLIGERKEKEGRGYHAKYPSGTAMGEVLNMIYKDGLAVNPTTGRLPDMDLTTQREFRQALMKRGLQATVASRKGKLGIDDIADQLNGLGVEAPQHGGPWTYDDVTDLVLHGGELGVSQKAENDYIEEQIRKEAERAAAPVTVEKSIDEINSEAKQNYINTLLDMEDAGEITPELKKELDELLGTLETSTAERVPNKIEIISETKDGLMEISFNGKAPYEYLIPSAQQRTKLRSTLGSTDPAKYKKAKRIIDEFHDKDYKKLPPLNEDQKQKGLGKVRELLGTLETSIADKLYKNVKPLTAEEKAFYMKEWKEKGSESARNKLITNNMKYVHKKALEYKKYHKFSTDELVSEGVDGLFKALDKFEPAKGFDFLTYADFWIDESIQKYIQKNWKEFEIGKDRSSRELLRSFKKTEEQAFKELGAAGQGTAKNRLMREVAEKLQVGNTELAMMSAESVSLTEKKEDEYGEEGEVRSSKALSEILKAEENQETLMIKGQERQMLQSDVVGALNSLDERERFIIENRILSEVKMNLGIIARKYGLSAERVRQVEKKAIAKLQKSLKTVYEDKYTERENTNDEAEQRREAAASKAGSGGNLYHLSGVKEGYRRALEEQIPVIRREAHKFNEEFIAKLDEGVLSIDEKAYTTRDFAEANELGRQNGFAVIPIKKNDYLNAFVNKKTNQIFVVAEGQALNLVGHELSHIGVKGVATNEEMRLLINTESEAFGSYWANLTATLGRKVTEVKALEEMVADLQGGLTENFGVNLYETVTDSSKLEYIVSPNRAAVSEMTEAPLSYAGDDTATRMLVKEHNKTPMKFSEAVDEFQRVANVKFPFREMLPTLDKLGVDVVYDTANKSTYYDRKTDTIYVGNLEGRENPSELLAQALSMAGTEAIVSKTLNLTSNLNYKSKQGMVRTGQLSIQLKQELLDLWKTLGPFRNLKEKTPEGKESWAEAKAVYDQIEKKGMAEFVKQGFHNKAFAAWLNSIPDFKKSKFAEYHAEVERGNPTLWTRFKKIVTRLFSHVFKAERTKLDALADIMNRWVDVSLAKEMSDFTVQEETKFALRYQNVNDYLKNRSYVQFGKSLTYSDEFMNNLPEKERQPEFLNLKVRRFKTGIGKNYIYEPVDMRSYVINRRKKEYEEAVQSYVDRGLPIPRRVMVSGGVQISTPRQAKEGEMVPVPSKRGLRWVSALRHEALKNKKIAAMTPEAQEKAAADIEMQRFGQGWGDESIHIKNLNYKNIWQSAWGIKLGEEKTKMIAESKQIAAKRVASTLPAVEKKILTPNEILERDAGDLSFERGTGWGVTQEEVEKPTPKGLATIPKEHLKFAERIASGSWSKSIARTAFDNKFNEYTQEERDSMFNDILDAIQYEKEYKKKGIQINTTEKPTKEEPLLVVNRSTQEGVRTTNPEVMGALKKKFAQNVKLAKKYKTPLANLTYQLFEETVQKPKVKTKPTNLFYIKDKKGNTVGKIDMEPYGYINWEGENHHVMMVHRWEMDRSKDTRAALSKIFADHPDITMIAGPANDSDAQNQIVVHGGANLAYTDAGQMYYITRDMRYNKIIREQQAQQQVDFGMPVEKVTVKKGKAVQETRTDILKEGADRLRQRALYDIVLSQSKDLAEDLQKRGFIDEDLNIKEMPQEGLFDDELSTSIFNRVPVKLPRAMAPLMDVIKRGDANIPADEFSKFMNVAEQYPGMKNKFGRYMFSLPHNNAKKSEDWKKQWDTAIRRIDTRMELEHEWLQEADVYLNRRKYLKAAGYTREQIDDADRRLNRILILGDERRRDNIVALEKEIKRKEKSPLLYGEEDLQPIRDKIKKIQDAQGYTRKELTDGIEDDDGTVIKLNDQEYVMYKAVRNTINSIFNERIEHLNTLALAQYKNQRWFKLLEASLGRTVDDATLVKIAGGLKSATLKRSDKVDVKLKDIFRKLDINYNKQVDLEGVPIVEEGFGLTQKESENVLKRYEKIAVSSRKEVSELKDYLSAATGITDVAELDKMTKDMFKAYQLMKPQLRKISALRSELNQWVGYFPRTRKEGKWKFSVYRKYLDPKSGAIKNKEVFTDFFNNDAEYGDAYSRAIKEFGKDGAFPEEYYTDYKPSDVSKEGTIEGMSDLNMQNTIDLALSHMKVTGEYFDENGKPIDVKANLFNAAYEALAEHVMSKGASKHSIHRKQKVGEKAIKGYQEEGLDQVLIRYITANAGLITRQTGFSEAMENLRNLKDKTRFGELKNYIAGMYRPDSKYDKWSSKARSFAFAWYLGAMVKSAFVNSTQPYIVGVPILANYMRSHGMQGYKANAIQIKASANIAQHFYTLVKKDPSKWGALSGLTQDETNYLSSGIIQGKMAAQQIRYIKGVSAGWGKVKNDVFDVLAAPFGMVEIYNRMSSALAMFRVSKEYHEAHRNKEEEQDAPIEKATVEADEFINDVHYAMGSHNRPAVTQTGTPTGAALETLYVFRTFTHNFLLSQFNLLRSGARLLSKEGRSDESIRGEASNDLLTVIHTMAMLGLFGGLLGLPFFKELFDWTEKKFGHSPKLWLRETLNGWGGETLETLGMGGLPALLGVNISGSLAVGVPGLNESPLESVFGVWGGLGEKFKRAGEAAIRGDAYRAATNLTPEFIRGPVVALTESDFGVPLGTRGVTTTATGGPVLDSQGKPLKYTKGEAVVKGLGFQPTGHSREREIEWSLKNQVNWANEQKRLLSERYKIDLIEKNPNAIKNLLNGVKEINGDIKSRGIPTTLASVSRIKKGIKTKIDKQDRRILKARSAYENVSAQ